MQQGRFRHDDMIHHPGAQPYGYVPTLVTRGVDQFCLAGMVWFWKALKHHAGFAAGAFMSQQQLDGLQALNSGLAASLSIAWTGNLETAGCARLARARLKVRM
jgi:hypothetical protein